MFSVQILFVLLENPALGPEEEQRAQQLRQLLRSESEASEVRAVHGDPGTLVP